jgi:hypothetical protein
LSCLDCPGVYNFVPNTTVIEQVRNNYGYTILAVLCVPSTT